MIRKIIGWGGNVLAFILALTVNSLANIIPIGGQTTGEISDKYPTLFTPAGFTFSIWSLIYLSLFLFMERKTEEEIRREKLPAEIQARMIVIDGKPAHEIVSLASQEKADIIVIATQGESGWQRFVFGSLVRRKLRRISDVNSNGRGTCQWAEFETTA